MAGMGVGNRGIDRGYCQQSLEMGPCLSGEGMMGLGWFGIRNGKIQGISCFFFPTMISRLF